MKMNCSIFIELFALYWSLKNLMLFCVDKKRAQSKNHHRKPNKLRWKSVPKTNKPILKNYSRNTLKNKWLPKWLPKTKKDL